MSFPTTPPPGLGVRPWDFTPVTRHAVPGGPLIVAARLASLPLVHVRWVFPFGRVHEPAATPGAARLLAATMRHGTARYDSAQLALALDHLGAHMQVGVAADSAVVSVSALSEHLDAVLELLDEVALRPTFPDDVVDRERGKALDMIRHELGQPGHLAGVWLGHALYGSHPYGRPTATPAGLLATTPQTLRDYHAALTRPDRAMLLVVGDVDPQVVIPHLAGRLAPAQPCTPLAPVPVIRPGPRRLIAVHRPDSQQSSITFGQLLFRRAHPDFLAMRIANQVLGAGAASRLFLDLRERRSLTYGVYSSLDLGRHGGDLTAGLSCEPAKTAEAVGALLEHMHRLVDEPIPDDELQTARQTIMGSFPLRASSLGGVAALISASWLNELPDDTWSRYRTRVADTDSAQVHRAVGRWIAPDAASLVVVGPSEQALAALEPLGPVEQRSFEDRGFAGATAGSG